jgi:anaerobic magnesium-protoporphyrin IX monomethyl ester cyclase
MANILLIQPPIHDFYLTAKRTQPYGLASIAASLRKVGFSVEIFDGLATAKSRVIPWPEKMDYLMPYYGRPDLSPFGLFHHYRRFGYSLEHIAKQAKASEAFLIGISSLFSAYSDVALETATAVKKVCPQVPIVLGGHHPTALPESVMDYPGVDYVLRGDGEVGLPALAKAIREKTSLESVPGLVHRTPGGAVAIKTPVVATDLDALPIPAFDLISWRHYQRAGRASLALTATRGCPMRCTYCAVNASSYHGYRRRSIESVMAELTRAFDLHPMGFIDFEDEHICADRQWVMALMNRIAHQFRRWRPELRAMNGLYAPNLDDEVLKSMQEAGFRTLNLALISTVVSQLKRFARPEITGDVDRVLRMARLRGLNTVAYLIVGGPDQDPYLSVDDLVFLAERKVLAGVSVFYPAPGSGDYSWCRRHDLLPSDAILMRSSALPLSHITDRTQAATLLRLGRVLNFMKSLLDHGESLPSAVKAPGKIDQGMDRVAIGKLLLGTFFADGILRGVDSDGGLYPHTVDLSLTNRFINRCRKIDLKGATV